MPIYSCVHCNFSSKIKTHYIRHLETKKHKKNIELVNSPKKPKEIKTIDININEEYFCDFCNSKFVTYSNKRRHELHRCKARLGVSKINNSLKKKENEIKTLKSQMKLLLSKVGTTNNTIINNTTNNTIQLNSYGNEDLSHITETLKTNLLHIPYGMIPKMIEVVHFNDKKPENKNIILANKKDNKIKIFSGNKWIYKNKEDTIKNLINEKYFILDTHYDSINENNSNDNNDNDNDNDNKELPMSTNNENKDKNYNENIIEMKKDTINSVIDNDDLNKKKYEIFRNKYDGNDKDLLEKLKRECELVLLNNR